MEQRWQNLKQIHGLISSGKKNSDQHLMPLPETKKLSAMLKILLSLEMKSCDQYPSRCLHCHQLLALSVVTMMFEDFNFNVVKIFCESLDEDFMDVVVKLLFCKRDLFLVYSSQKAVLAVLNSDLMLKKQKTNFLEKIISGMELKEYYQIQSVLEILTSALSSKKTSNLNEVCFNVVSSKLTKIIHIWKKSQKELDYYVFSLLRKFVKYVNKQKCCVELLENIFSGAILEFIPILFSDYTRSCGLKDLDLHSEKMKPYIFHLKESDTFNHCSHKSDEKQNSNRKALDFEEKHLPNGGMPSKDSKSVCSEFKKEMCSNNIPIPPERYREKQTELNKKCPLSKMTTRKLLDFLNEFLNFSSHLVLKKNVAVIYVLISGNFIDHLTRCECNINLFTNCVGFTGAKESTCQIDFPLTRRVMLLSFTCFAVTIKHDHERCLGDVLKCLQVFLDSMTVLILPSADKMSLQWLSLVFEDQDDSYIECVLCLLDIYSWLNIRYPNTTILEWLEPCPLFLQLLQTVNFDPSIIMDWLVSPETCFLLYISRFLKYVINNWFKFTQAAHARYGSDCDQSEQIDNEVSKDDPVDIDSAAIATDNDDSRNKLVHNTTSLEDKKVNQELPDMTSSNCIHGNLVKSEKIFPMQGKVDNSVMKLTSSMAAIMTYSDSDDEGDLQDNGDIKPVSGMEYTEMTSYPNIDLNDASNIKSIDDPDGKGIADSDIDSNIDDEQCKNSSDDMEILPNTFNVSDILIQKSNKKLLSCEMRCCDQVMSMFIRVRFQIERLVEQDLFPYNPSPLLSLLYQCEDLYESTE